MNRFSSAAVAVLLVPIALTVPGVRAVAKTGYYLDASVVSVGPQGGGTRAVVSVILNTYPGRDMRAILQGAATVPGASGPSAERQAIEGALRGALRRLPQAMAASRR